MSDFIEIAFWVIAASAVVFILPGLYALSRSFAPPTVPPLPEIPPVPMPPSQDGGSVR